MIERLLAAEDALRRDELELAERLFRQVADADARNAIALVGLARIALARGDRTAARALLVRALEIDPEEAAARRLVIGLDAPAPAPEAAPEAASTPGATPDPAAAPEHADPEPAMPTLENPAAAGGEPPPRRPSLLDRIRRWLGLPPAQP